MALKLEGSDENPAQDKSAERSNQEDTAKPEGFAESPEKSGEGNATESANPREVRSIENPREVSLGEHIAQAINTGNVLATPWALFGIYTELQALRALLSQFITIQTHPVTAIEPLREEEKEDGNQEGKA